MTVRFSKHRGRFGQFSLRQQVALLGGNDYGPLSNLTDSNWAYGETICTRELTQTERSHPFVSSRYECDVHAYWVVDHCDMDEPVDLAISATVDSSGRVDIERILPVTYGNENYSDIDLDGADLVLLSYNTTAYSLDSSYNQNAYVLPGRMAGTVVGQRRGIESLYQRYINTSRRYRFYWIAQLVGNNSLIGYSSNILVATYTPEEGFKNTGNPSPDGYVIKLS